MGGLAVPLLWAQAVGSGAGAPASAGSALSNPTAVAGLALRRWYSGLTLSSPGAVPTLDGLWAFLAGLVVLLLAAVAVQGPGTALRQFLDIPGHLALVRRATARVWRAGRVIVAAITLTVASWTGSQTLGFLTETADRGRTDLTLLTRSRGQMELALEQGVLAGLTPLRDLAGLADNLALLAIAVYLVFRASSGTLPPMGQERGRAVESAYQMRRQARRASGWATLVWGCAALYLLYRLVARFAGSADLPVGGCLVVEAVLIPFLMIVCDGFLLAWVVTEIRNAGFDAVGEETLHPGQALELMPAAGVACALVMPARYVATFVFLTWLHLPTTVGATWAGRYIRWQLGWGLADLQAAALTALGLVGVLAWSRGSIADLWRGYGRLLRREGGHLVVTLAMAGLAAGLLAGMVYPLVLLLPPAGWVLPAADSYAHYVTLPVGLWTIAALIDLAERTLPVAVAAPEPTAPSEAVASSPPTELLTVSDPPG